MEISRLAPSPTGLLHPGNIWSFMCCWLAVRRSGGRIILRVDDIDGPRSRQEYIEAIFRDLKWLGFDWDGKPTRQSDRIELYANVLNNLRDRGLVYPCFCSRAELRAMASAPNRGDLAANYPGTCRDLTDEERAAKLLTHSQFALRIKTPDSDFRFRDLVLGERRSANCGGDIAALRSDNVFSYQFATAVDDFLLDASLIVRGADLVDSTPAQIYIRSLLGDKPVSFAHIPLLLAPNGERLAKRHKSESVAALREKGWTAERIIGRLAFIGGLSETDRSVSLAELIRLFAWERIPRRDLVWNGEL
ncbi:MAG: tRNA glutamyl-Q(34) synthetase GluQRS [Desulfovibrio sp.]|nr:tRNA glutamyl-Q(34) synthetase GluQRS [Desulfovibrio sp.]